MKLTTDEALSYTNWGKPKFLKFKLPYTMGGTFGKTKMYKIKHLDAVCNADSPKTKPHRSKKVDTLKIDQALGQRLYDEISIATTTHGDLTEVQRMKISSIAFLTAQVHVIEAALYDDPKSFDLSRLHANTLKSLILARKELIDVSK